MDRLRTVDLGRAPALAVLGRRRCADLAIEAEALKLTPEDLKKYQLIDEIIPEPEGGAQNDPAGMAKQLAAVLERQLRELCGRTSEDLLACRYNKFRAMGAFGE